MSAGLPSPVSVAPPAGFVPSEIHDPFEAYMGPLFERTEADGSRLFAFIADARHVDETGAVHEGMLMTFADAFLGGAANRAAGGDCVTLSMQASFLTEARAGDVIECRTQIDRVTRAIIFVSGRFSVSGADVATATSLWKVLGAR
ncbi:PaaI family thioesterase [Parvibaculum sp.]|uniref:PaaI family thioesterase n=1 Tax=Parvibaculum sp. TaxID=2024848 RepID=UPI0034A035CF